MHQPRQLVVPVGFFRLRRTAQRIEIRLIHPARLTQARVTIVVEQEKLVGLRKLNVLDELFPVIGLVAFGQLDDRSESVGLVDAAQITCGEPKPFEHRQLFGGQFLTKLFAFVGPGGVFLDCLKQLVAHNAAGQLAAVEKLGHALGQQINVADKRHRDAAFLKEQFDLVELPHVVAELRNDPPGAGGDFAHQLEILRHKLALVTLKGRDDAADEKVGFGQRLGLAAASQNIKPLVHRLQQRDESDGIKVEHRVGPASEAAGGIIARDGQNILETLRGITPSG